MAKASPLIRSFNAGEFSALMQGRPDIDRYPASLKSMFNFIAAPQGPAIARSGTAFTAPNADENEFSALVPFIFSSEQAKLLEFSNDRIRFIDEDGLQVYASVVADVTSAAGDFIQFTSATLNANVGDQVVLLEFPSQYNLNGEVVKIVSKAGSVYTLDKEYPEAVAVVDGKVARVYHVPCVYTEAQRSSLRFVQSVDVMYLFNGSKPRKLSRFGDYDWRLEDFVPVDGPYMPVNETDTKLTPSATGNAVPNMTADNAPSGIASGSGNLQGANGTAANPVDLFGRYIPYAYPTSQYWYAFTNNEDVYWASNTPQKGIIQYTPSAPFVCDGYTIYVPKDNRDGSYIAKDYAPGTFKFEGYDGTKWVTLDQQEEYLLYDKGKSVFFEIDNTVAYQAYRLNIQKNTRNGSIETRVRQLVMRSTASAVFNLTASATKGINFDKGFLATDVGRLIRIKGGDGSWRPVEVTAVVSSTVVTVKLLGQPLVSLDAIKDWRLGYWSTTTGYPVSGDFFEDRLWLAGPQEAPDMFAGSVVGAYETFKQTDEFGEVLDDSAVVGRLNSRKLSRVRWISSDERGLIMGTGSEEYTLRAPNNEVLTARNAKARPSTRRGSAAVEPVRIDSQVLYVQRSGRTLREFAFVFESDGYKSPSMSQLASHLGAAQFVEMDYAAEPHSIVWVRRKDGSLVGLTYNRDENVVGWHRHAIAGGDEDGDAGAVIESLAVLPQRDQVQDALWLTVRRTIDGKTRRYIERLTPFWDFGYTIDDAHYVDSGLRYNGPATTRVYGLQHLEGEDVYGLADGLPVGPLKVVGGAVTLSYASTSVILGLGYESEAETSRLENGAADGTALGKVKRINSIVPMVWESCNGKIGVYNEEENGPVYEPLEYPGRLDEIDKLVPYTGELKPITPSPGYDMRATLYFKREKDSPLPLNILCLMPQLNTQDR